ncbi:MAG TPA: 6,7-dimethyl-8-ribityllumazine synthase [Acidimicrobiales bacterium]|nr:6,7-dimethyl-8-ribityllumazine synthase [Acidimicrobiales bacterium]
MTSSDKTSRKKKAGAGAAAGGTEGRPGQGLRVALVCGRFNDLITEKLRDGARAELVALGVDPLSITEVWVPGAFELPLMAKRLAQTGEIDAVVCLGAVIRGDTGHYEFVAGQCAAGIQAAQLDTGVPMTFGVLTTENDQQALDRAGGVHGNKGAEAASTAVEMADLLRKLPVPAARS